MDVKKKIAQELSGNMARKHIDRIAREIPFRLKTKAFLSPAPLETQRSQREKQDLGVRNQESETKSQKSES